MTLKHLKIFSEVCRNESITKAATSLNMAQPAVSTAIHELEVFYHVKLFERMNRKIYITNAGSNLLEYADSILSLFEESKDVLQDIAASTQIRIGSNVSFGINYLSKIVSDFKIKYPEIPIYSLIQNSSQIEDRLLHNELDFAIVDNLSENPSIKQTLLASDTLIALYSPELEFPSAQMSFFSNGHYHKEVSVSDFSKIPLLLREPGSGNRDTLDRIFHQYGIHPNIALESTSTQVLVEFCLNGQGVLFLPITQARPFLSSGQLLELSVQNMNTKRNYYFSYHCKKYLTKSMRCFSDYILHDFIRSL